MTIDGDAAYQVLLAHDARFDGRLFVGVTSTGVYCRPICRVRMPARRNCRFFASPAQAEAASFRPCLKCRPEIAPGPGLAWTVMDASRTLARQAASALDEFASDGEAPSVAAIAERLGVSDRHLRRIFFAEHGVTPLQYLQTRRLLLAKQLLTDTQMPVAQIALTSGFRSLRRFNAAFLGGYRMNPTRLRRATPRDTAGATAPARTTPSAAAVDRSGEITVTLGYRAPYDVDALIAFLAQRAIPGIEVASARSIRRSVRAGVVGASAGWLEARFASDAARVRLSFAPALGPTSGAVIAAARRWLDLDAAPETIAETLVGLPGKAGFACREASTPSSSPCAPSSASRSRSRRRGRSRAASSSASAPTSRRPGATSRAPSRARPTSPPCRSSGSPSSASSAAAPARSRRSPCTGMRSRRCSRPARRPKRSSIACARCPASARGRRTTSRCARSAGRMRSRPATSPP
jgi:methylphosphotriester-DNA--protein-cysteine methyltransferase